MTGPVMFSLAATLLWGFWGVTAKLVADRIGYWPSALIYSLVSLLTVLTLTLANHVDFCGMKAPGILLVVLAGVPGGLAVSAFQKAISTGPLSSSISLMALYPVIPVLYEIMLLGEEVTLTRGIGVRLAVAAGVMLCL